MYKIFNELEANGAIYLRGDKTFKDNGDIDYYVYKNNIKNIKNILEKNDFTIVNENNSHIHAKKYDIDDNKIYFLDFKKNFDYIFEKFNGISFNKNFINKYIKNPSKNNIEFNTIRYILFKRNDKKYIDFFKKNKKEIEKNNIYINTCNINIFKKSITISKIIYYIKGGLFSDFLIFKNLVAFKLLLRKVKKSIQRIGNIGKGETIVLLGPDGIGKTTIAKTIEKLGYKGRYFYAGYNVNYMILGDFYLKWQPKNKILQTIKYILFYLETIYKLIKIFSFKIRGISLVLDRYPTFEVINTNKSKIAIYIDNLLYYKLFYIPKKIFLLYDSPKNIMKRKDELTEKQINDFYTRIEKIMKNRNMKYKKIINKNINTTIRTIYKV